MADREHGCTVVVPDDARVVGVISVAHYLNPDGSFGYAVTARGEETPGTTYLGLLVRAQQEVLAWSDREQASNGGSAS